MHLKKILKNFIRKIIKLFYLIILILKIIIQSFKKINKIRPTHDLPYELVVSLTSYPERFKTLHHVVKSLLMQSIKPNKIILWIQIEHKEFLTKKITELAKYGLEINFCKNYKSYNKIVHSLIQESDKYIATFDDDILYSKDALRYLVETSKLNPGCVASNRIHKIKLNKDLTPMPYKSWDWDYPVNDQVELNFLTGVGGSLYPPRTFNEDVLRLDLIKKLSPHADDIWLNWMLRINGKKVIKTKFKERLLEIPDFKKGGLRALNVNHGRNDEQILKMIKYFGFVFNK